MAHMLMALRCAVHVLVFLLAARVGYLGLVVGLSYSPLLGMVLGLAAVTLIILNVKWMQRALRPHP